MPGVYPKGELEIVGFSVGVVEREAVIDGSTISDSDVLIGLASSGFHSNGYSLVRSVLDAGLKAGKFDLFEEPAGMRTNLASALIAPTKIYVKPLLNLIRDFDSPRHGSRHRRRLRGQYSPGAARWRVRSRSTRKPGPAPMCTSGSRGKASCRRRNCCASSIAASA